MIGGSGVSYRTKLTTFFLLATTISFLVGIYSYVSSRVLMNDMTQMLDRTQHLTGLYNDLVLIQQATEDYLFTRSSDSLQAFYDYSNSITALMQKLKQDMDYTQRGVKITNLYNMLDHYLKALDQVIIDKRNKKTDAYIAGYQEAKKQYDYIGHYIEKILSTDLADSAQKYANIKQEIDRSAAINYFLFGITILLTIVTIVLFSNEITKPLRKLVSYAREIIRGEFDVEIKQDKTSSEVRILFQTFRMMTESIKEYINELREKQKLERKLNEEKLNNLKMKSALQETELLSLQSQVNPHFIFNSINIGAKIAMLQGDKVTCEYLENFADLFRYSLKGLGYNATLQEEIENVTAYMNLLIVRFGGLIDFRISVPEDKALRSLVMPRMTLQPLVENAFIHGASQNEDGGTIKLEAEVRNGRALITISNTGREIPEETIRLILSQKYEKHKDQKRQGHTTGIGIVNVLSRLRLFYKQEDVMEIRCSDGWTRFILKLPLLKEEAV